MKSKMAVEPKLEEMKDRSWLFYLDEDGDRVFIDDEETIADAADIWDISTEAVTGIMQSLNNVVECIVDTAIEDLEDVWQLAECGHKNALTAMAILNDDGSDDGEGFCGDDPNISESGAWEECLDCEDKDDCQDYQNHRKDNLSNSRVN